MTLDKFAALRDRDAVPDSYRTIERLAEEPLSQAVYRRLRQDITSGALRPNERLVETELGELFEVSRTPVRDALLRLEADGVVDAGKRGWTVHEYDRDELVAIYETRAALEGAAARLAALRATEEQLADIEVVLESEQADLHADSGSDVTSRENSQFHSMIYESCRNDRLVGLIERNAQIYFNYRVASLYTPEELELQLAGHFRLLAALKRRDADAAEREQTEHLFEGLEILLRKGRW
jgi:DNA-binding GntR family transcriptional regulator